MATRMQQRRGTAAEWAAANPVLSDGEIGYERDTAIVKIGDGTTAWSALPYAPIPKSVITALGDLIVGSGVGAVSRVARGTTGQRLTVQANGSLAWETPIAPIPLSVVTAAADLIVGTGAGTVARLPRGTAGQALKVAPDGVSLFWETPPSADLSSRIPLSTVTAAGDLIVGTANAAVGRLGMGAAGTVLTVNPGGTALTWSASPDLAPYARKDVGTTQTFTGAVAAAGVYDGANRVYSASNPPPGGGGASINQTIRGVISLAYNVTTATVTIPSVNVAKAQLRYLGDLGGFGGQYPESNAYLQLTNATTITAVHRGNSSGMGSSISYEVTEWT